MTTPPTTPSSLVEHAAFVRALARHLVADPHGAEDVAQDTWLAALQRPPRHDAHPRAWLAKLVERLAWRRGRAVGRRRRREEAAAHGERLEGVDETLARAELLRRVTDAVLALEEPYRATVLERFYEDRDAPAIAERSGVPLATVRSRLQRALALLRERLDREYGERGAWSAGLLALIGEPGPTVGPAGSAASGGAPPAGAALSAGTGGLAMSAASKAGMGLAAAALAGVLLWRATLGGRGERPDARAEAPRAARLAEPRADAPTELAPGRAPESAQRSTVPSTAALAPALGALEGRVTWQHDGGPVAGEELRLLARSQPAGTRLKRALADADGRYRVEGLAPGKVDVETAHGAGNTVQITAGETATLDLWIPTGFAVRGRVVDPQGLPVPGARLWLSSYFSYHTGCIVGVTRGDGSFEIQDVQEARYVGAVADHFAPADLVFLPDLQAGDPLAPVAPTLTLAGLGGALELRIVGPDGSPVADAYVHARGATPPSLAADHRGFRTVPTFDSWSGAEGLAWIDGLAPGACGLSVYAAGMGPWKGTTAIEAASTRTLVVELRAEGVVTGIVRGPDGAPVADARIAIGEEYDPFQPSTRSDAEGGYELRSLPPGELSLKAEHSRLGSASTTLHVASTELVTWDPVLAANRVLSGHVLDEDGAPLAGWTVQVDIGRYSSWRGQATTDAEGAFRMVDLETEPLTLELYRDPSSEELPTVRRPIGEDETEILLRVTRDQLCDASLAGRFLDPEGLPIPRANVALWLPGSASAPSFRTDESGIFRVEHLCPGSYDVTVGFEDRAHLFLGRLTIRPREARDLGTIALEDPAVLRLTVNGQSPEASEAFGEFNLRQLDAEGHSGWAASPGRAAAAAGIPLQPGHYTLAASGRGIASECLRLELRAGETTIVDLVPRAGRYVSVVAKIPAGAARPRRIRCIARDGDGDVLMDMESEPLQGRFGWGLSLAPGPHAFELQADDGRRALGSFTVELDDPPGSGAVEFRLPLR